jgi:predicted enzyme related to lactoylglutathione lyase
MTEPVLHPRFTAAREKTRAPSDEASGLLLRHCVLQTPGTELHDCGVMTVIECLVPILRVADLAVSRRYYLDILGFTVDWDAGRMISVSRDGNPIMICEGAQGQPGTWLWVGVEDAEALFAEVSERGACVRSPPQNFYWAYEFQIEDPDGHVLRFGSEAKPGPKSGVFKS